MILFEGKDRSFPIVELEAYIDEVKARALGRFVYLQTCNRVELYRGDGEALRSVARHLFRVAAGLESKMLGEGHVLGQVRRAYLASIEQRNISPGLHRLFQHAIHTGKRVRAETAISRGAVTHGQAAVGLLAKNVPHLQDSSILIIGANRLTGNVVIGLCSEGCRQITIVNRTIEKAQELAEKASCAYAPYAHLSDRIGYADVIVTAISYSGPIIRSVDLPVDRTVTIVDLAVPRNVDPKTADNARIRLFNLEDVEAAMERTIAGRAFEVLRAEEIIDEELISYYGSFERSNRRVENPFAL